MTDKLRAAWIAEAKRRSNPCDPKDDYASLVAENLLDLIQADWRPEPEVDAVTLAYRGWALGIWPHMKGDIELGSDDASWHADAFRAGHAHGQANHPDTKRMDWLEGQKLSIEATRVKDDLHHYPNATPPSAPRSTGPWRAGSDGR